MQQRVTSKPSVQLADVVSDLAADAALVLVIVGAEVFIPGAGADSNAWQTFGWMF
jgi:hypothetical protein